MLTNDQKLSTVKRGAFLGLAAELLNSGKTDCYWPLGKVMMIFCAGGQVRHVGHRDFGIRNFVLTEVTLNFLNLALEIFKHAEPVPENLIITLSLNNMNESGITCSLSPNPDNRVRLPI